MEPTIIGVDIAKQVFQLHWIDRETGKWLTGNSSEVPSWNISQIVNPV